MASDAVRTLLIDAHGSIWAGTKDQGVDVLDPKTGDARHLRHRDGDPRSLPADAVATLFADRSGRIWVGTDAGLSRYEPRSGDFVNYGAAASGANPGDLRVRAIREDHARRTLDRHLPKRTVSIRPRDAAA